MEKLAINKRPAEIKWTLAINDFIWDCKFSELTSLWDCTLTSLILI